MDYPFSSPGGYEEQLNQQVAGYLHYSLQIDASLLNRIHDDHPFEFTSEARIIADQDSPLPRTTDEGTDREIDWVISDEELIVGYESKYGAPLEASQLCDELAKLRLNAQEQRAKLVAITPHTTPPSALDEFADEPVYWLSWTTVVRKLNQIDEADLNPEQRPIVRMLQDLFEAENMNPFTGFDHQNKQQYRYFVRDLRQELGDTELENRGKIHTWTSTDPDPPTYRRLVPKYLDIPFVRASRSEGRGTKRGSYLTVIVDTERHDVHAGVVFNVREVESHREFVAEHTDELVAYATDHGLSLWASYNSLNHWKNPPPKTDNPAEMRAWLSEASREVIEVNGVSYKKAFFVRQCSGSEPAELTDKATSILLEQYDNLLVDNRLYPAQTL